MAGQRVVGGTTFVLALLLLDGLSPRPAAAQAPLDLGEYCANRLTYSNGRMFFYNDLQSPQPPGLYTTDGTPGETVRISHAGTGFASGVDVNGILLFPSAGSELWRSDGTAAGTYRLPSPPLAAVQWGHLNGRVVFWTDPPGAGMELWTSDGTAAGTTLLKAFAVGLPSHSLPGFGTVNGFVMFFADDGLHGNELWRTAGTPATTLGMADLTAGPGSSRGGFPYDFNGSPDGAAPRAATGVFVAATGTPLEIGTWRTDGTTQGTGLLRRGIAQVIQEVDGLAFLSVPEAHSTSLWRSDGTPHGTVLLKSFQPWIGAAARLNDLLIVSADDGPLGPEPWRSDGSPHGTDLIRDIHPGPTGGFHGQGPGANGNGRYFFSASSGAPFLGLWQTDGTSEGTLLAAEVPGADVMPPFSASGDRLFFKGSPCRLLTYPLPPADATRGDILWRNRRTGEVSAWLMDGVGREREVRIDYTTFPGPSWEVAGTADFNGDARMDLLWRDTTTGHLEAWFLDGPRRLRAVPLNPPAMPATAWRVAATGDFNGDAKADIVWRHAGSGHMAVWYMDGVDRISETPTTPPAVAGQAWQIVGAGRFNSDSQTDLLWWHSGSGQLAVWYMNEAALVLGEFTSPAAVPDTAWRPVATGDYNADGKTDIVWHHSGSGQAVVWHMDGAALASGTFTTPEGRPAADWSVVGPR